MPTLAVDYDTLLETSRRLDWRFLLAGRKLGRVVCLGEHDPELVEALRLFSDSLAESNAVSELSDRSCDLVVVRNANIEELEDAVSLLRPAGWLYAEVERSRRGGRRSALSVRSCARACRQLDLLEIATYVHWPDFQSCRAIVPLDSPAVLRHALARTMKEGRADLLSRLGPKLAATRLLARVVPCASVVARRGPSGAEGAS
jgi:hypothetical protein